MTHLLSLALLLAPFAGDEAALPAPVATSRPTVADAAVRDLGPVLEVIRKRHDLPALAAVVLTSDGVIAEGYTGVRKRVTGDPGGGTGEGRERAGEVAVTRSDRFHFGSCTKAMTATLLARSVEDGTLAWDTTVGATFPELVPGMHPAWTAATLAQLVSHTAGAPGDLLAFQPLALAVTANKKPLPELRALSVRELTRVEPAFEPGTSYLYSNWGYVVAAAMLETKTGRAWEELIEERLFEPLGMQHCGFGAPPADGVDEPCGHTEQGRPAPGQDNPATIGPAGTVHGPLSDWARFVQLHLLGARGDGDLLLKPESFAWLHAPRPGTNGTYGAGWIVTSRPWSKGPVLAHNGSNTLWFAWVWIAPAEDLAVLVVTNQGGAAAQKGADDAAWALIQDQLARIALDDPATEKGRRKPRGERSGDPAGKH